jgi:hypothetical protein
VAAEGARIRLDSKFQRDFEELRDRLPSAAAPPPCRHPHAGWRLMSEQGVGELEELVRALEARRSPLLFSVGPGPVVPYMPKIILPRNDGGDGLSCSPGVRCVSATVWNTETFVRASSIASALCVSDA